MCLLLYSLLLAPADIFDYHFQLIIKKAIVFNIESDIILTDRILYIHVWSYRELSSPCIMDYTDYICTSFDRSIPP